MPIVAIRPRPKLRSALSLLESAALPVSDLTDAHLEHFFLCGPESAPTGLVGLEICDSDALLRSLVVAPESRSGGIGSALVQHAEAHARTLGARAVFLLTTTAEEFFSRRGYERVPRESAPASIRNTREFAELCPSTSTFMVKKL